MIAPFTPMGCLPGEARPPPHQCFGAAGRSEDGPAKAYSAESVTTAGPIPS